MPEIPKTLVDLGAAVVIIFLFVCAIFLIMKIVQISKGTFGKTQNGNGENWKRPRCLDSPVVSQLSSNQALYMKAIERLEHAAAEMSKNLILQTALLGRVAAVQEKMGDCMLRIQAHDEVRNS